MVVEEIPILKDIIADNQKLIDVMTDTLEGIREYCDLFRRNSKYMNWLTGRDACQDILHLIESSGVKEETAK